MRPERSEGLARALRVEGGGLQGSAPKAPVRYSEVLDSATCRLMAELVKRDAHMAARDAGLATMAGSDRRADAQTLKLWISCAVPPAHRWKMVTWSTRYTRTDSPELLERDALGPLRGG